MNYILQPNSKSASLPLATELLTSAAFSGYESPAHSDKNFKGTTTVGITFKDGVVLAADKRATMGSFIAAKDVDKIHVVGDRMGITMAGGVGDAQVLVRLLRAEIELYKYAKGKPMSVQAASTLLSNVLQGSKYYPFLVQLIVAGYDETGPALFDLDPFGGLIPEKYVSTGSGSVTAYGLLDENYRDNLNREETVQLAVRAVNSAMRRDSATGEGVDCVVITADGIKRLTRDEVNGIIKPMQKAK